MIPPILHQTWKEPELPPALQPYAEKMKRMHPSYKYKLWLDPDLRAAVARVTPQWLSLYDRMQYNIERVDFARYAIMYEEGGFYLDTDMETLQSLDQLLSENRVILGTEPVEHKERHYPQEDRVLCNAFMASPPHQEYWLRLMNFIGENYDQTHAWPVHRTGPMAMTTFMKVSSPTPDLDIRSPCAFFSEVDEVKDGKPVTSRECTDPQEMIAVHHWAHTWAPEVGGETNFPRHEDTNTVVQVWFWVAIALLVVFTMTCIYWWWRKQNQRTSALEKGDQHHHQKTFHE